MGFAKVTISPENDRHEEPMNVCYSHNVQEAMIMQILITAQVYKMKIIQYQKRRQELFKFVVLPEARLMRSQKMCLQMTCIEVP